MSLSWMVACAASVSIESFKAGTAQWLEWRENFLLQGQLSVPTLILESVPPPCYLSSTKDPGHSAEGAGGQ